MAVARIQAESDRTGRLIVESQESLDGLLAGNR
jgi:hypothetical protein